MLGKLTAGSPATTTVEDASGNKKTETPVTDQSLPDPTRDARAAALLLGVIALVTALVFDATDKLADPFDATANKDLNFIVLAGFYVAALIVERAGEVFAAGVPPWAPPEKGLDDKPLDAAQRAAHTKADRQMVMTGVNWLLLLQKPSNPATSTDAKQD